MGPDSSDRCAFTLTSTEDCPHLVKQWLSRLTQRVFQMFADSNASVGIRQVDFSLSSSDRDRVLHAPFSITRTGGGSNAGVKVLLSNGQTVELNHPLMLHRPQWSRTYDVHVDTGRVLPRLLSRNKRPIWSSAGPLLFPAESTSKRCALHACQIFLEQPEQSERKHSPLELLCIFAFVAGRVAVWT